MRQLAGIAVALLSLPLLFWLQHAVAAEWQEANAYKEQVEQTIELSDPVVTIPMALYDRNGDLFAEEYTEWRDPLPLSEIPLFAKQLFLESEDKGFYEHRGYDVAAIARAFAVNVNSEGRSQGASTITQQVVRMRFLSPEKTYERKFREILYSAELEKQATKDEILEMYMNEMYFGNQVYGIGAAATYYFSKPLSKLNEAETAFLAAIPNNPSMYDPLRHFAAAKKRQERLLGVLTASNVISGTESKRIAETPVVLRLKQKNSRFPAYQTYAANELKQLIDEKEGFTARLKQAETDEQRAPIRKQAAARYAEVVNSGIRIDTALDPRKQRKVDERISSLLNGSGIQAGSAVIDNSSRELVALYGGYGYRKTDFNRSFQAVRQPGSAMKPLLVYAPYLESGPFTENSLVDGSGICIGSYCPKNFGGYQYGVTTLKKAFSRSYNTSAVRLMQHVGVEKAFAHLSPFQFRHITEKDHQYTAALGGFENGTTPYELADAYTSFTDGTYQPSHAIRAIKDRSGKVLYTWDSKRRTVWSPKTASAVRSMLQETVQTGTARGVRQTTSFTGAKTGTTSAYKDLWVAGLNDDYTAAVWTGYDRPHTMQQESERKLHLQLFSAALSD
ncbi:penicillin-binding protein 4 [Sporosarcina sp. NCCP-2716]|uniref:transglycosylase domain-containing protein n=1 Tax=Sporosarcina sp. NCCP-2716 TaxID=2943679 RepID=UPI00203E8978|nr:transglycosylase domain-containing protein [Sporosarcina sp. NCCP-2716]GKV70004.1 penicillin-binding protein 4 [Sporosarcina sp. NCCP-2716]